MKNYLPFARRQTVLVPPRLSAVTFTGGQATTGLDPMATSGVRSTIIEDIIISEITAADVPGVYHYAGDGGMIKCRIGIDGRRFLTENLYDYRVMTDKARPQCACWDWSLGGRYPYRIYPGQKMSVTMQLPDTRNKVHLPCRAIFFNGVNVNLGIPQHLYGMNTDVIGLGANRVAIVSPQLKCPEEGPLDLFSVTHPWWWPSGNVVTPVHITDGTDRAFWTDPRWAHIIDPYSSPISLGAAGWQMLPDETLRIEFRNAMVVGASINQSVTVIIRGVLEVEDGR